MINNYKFIEDSFIDLKKFCEKEEFKGWDPYDGLNSWIIQKTILGKSRLFRLAWIQLFKRSPINLRVVFGVRKDYNPKGLGLFLTGYCNLYKKDPKQEYLTKINFLTQKILELRTPGYSGACWGYNFDWQSRAFFQPKFTPTVVATTFIVESLLLVYEITKEEELLNIAKSSTKFILSDLNKTHDSDNNYTLSYSPLDKTQVYNAGLLGAKLLCLVYQYSKEEVLIMNAKKIVSFVCKCQREDGAWTYGTLPFHQWIDNFHTGYNLECISTYQQISKDKSFDKNISKGLKYYLKTFFTEDGISKYYNDRVFPIDIHAPAQLIVTLSKLKVFSKNEALINRVLEWTINNMQSNKGYFYYQKNKFFTSKIPYIRWAQAWMFYALSYYTLDTDENKHTKH
jgi:rhamnogalacturonyl hydrolase YesR